LALDLDAGSFEDLFCPPLGIASVAPFHLLHEVYGGALGTAAVAVEDALLDVHTHGGPAVPVDRAAGHFLAPAAFVEVYAVVGEDRADRDQPSTRRS
jgi:hypothetical protein